MDQTLDVTPMLPIQIASRLFSATDVLPFDSGKRFAG